MGEATGRGRGGEAMRGRRWPAVVGAIPLAPRPATGRHGRRRHHGRAFDVAVALLLLALALPLLVAIAVAVKVESPGPLFYRAWRVGYRGAPVGVLKFRKMHHDAHGPALTVRGDDRLTRVGKVLVRTHLDELPQLWNVVRGDMSLVGPRPEDARFVACQRHAYRDVLTVRPGITGWSQLVLADEPRLLAGAADPVRFYVDEVLPAKVALDAAYVSARGTLGDLKVLAWTLLVVALPFAVVLDPERSELRLWHVRHPRQGGDRGDGEPAPAPSPTRLLAERLAG